MSPYRHPGSIKPIPTIACLIERPEPFIELSAKVNHAIAPSVGQIATFNGHIATSIGLSESSNPHAEALMGSLRRLRRDRQLKCEDRQDTSGD